MESPLWVRTLACPHRASTQDNGQLGRDAPQHTSRQLADWNWHKGNLWCHFVPQRLQRSGLQNVTHHPWGEDEDCDNVTLDPGCAAAFFLEADVKQSEWQALKDSVTNLTVIVTLLAAAAVLFTAF